MGAVLSSQGGVRSSELLLNVDPTAETGAADATYTPTYVGRLVTVEEWRRDDATLLKRIDYTYVGTKVSVEVRKVYAPDGVTVAAQLTWSYTYAGSRVTSAVMTRDV